MRVISWHFGAFLFEHFVVAIFFLPLFCKAAFYQTSDPAIKLIFNKFNVNVNQMSNIGLFTGKAENLRETTRKAGNAAC